MRKGKGHGRSMSTLWDLPQHRACGGAVWVGVVEGFIKCMRLEYGKP